MKSATFRQPGKLFIFGREPVRIDVLTGPSGVQFDECYRRRNVVVWDGVRVPLISFEDLKQNKLASGRDKDLDDLKNLPPPSAEKRGERRPPRRS